MDVANGISIIILAIAVYFLSHTISHLKHQVHDLEHACIPTYTGGGVWQCAQPNTMQTTRP